MVYEYSHVYDAIGMTTTLRWRDGGGAMQSQSQSNKLTNTHISAFRIYVYMWMEILFMELYVINF